MKDSILEIIAKAYDGDVDAQIELGDRYSDGDELDVNLKEAFFGIQKLPKLITPLPYPDWAIAISMVKVLIVIMIRLFYYFKNHMIREMMWVPIIWHCATLKDMGCIKI